MVQKDKWRALRTDLLPGQQGDFIFYRHSLTALLSATLQFSRSETSAYQISFPDGGVGLATAIDAAVVCDAGREEAGLEEGRNAIIQVPSDDLSTRLRSADHEWLPLYVTRTNDWNQIKAWAPFYASALLFFWSLQFAFVADSTFAAFMESSTAIGGSKPSYFFAFVKLPSTSLFTKSRVCLFIWCLQLLSLFNLALVPMPLIKGRASIEILATLGTYFYNVVTPVVLIHYVISCIQRTDDVLRLVGITGSYAISRSLEHYLTSRVVLLAP